MAIDVEQWEGYTFIDPRYGQPLSMSEIDYWKDAFIKNLKVAYEIEVEFPRNVSLDTIRSGLNAELKPTNRATGLSETGVNEVKSDGSLSHGLEITTVGKRIHFWELHELTEKITKELLERKAINSPRCGLHTHLIFAHYGSQTELEKPIPGIIFRNFYNLLKRHLPELIYLTASLNKNKYEAITRYEFFCKAQHLMGRHNNKDLAELIGQINEKYSFLNPYDMAVVPTGDALSKFHIELRFADSSLIPLQIVSMSMLYAAILVKAIELSKYGLISCGSDPYWERTKVLYKEIRNDTGLGFSDSRRTSVIPDQTVLDEIQLRAKHLVLAMKQPLRYFDRHVHQVLEKMAGYPVFQQYINGKKPKDIEKYLMIKDDREKKEFLEITQIIDTYQIINCKDKREWEQKVAELLGVGHKAMNNRVWKLSKVRALTFDSELGAVIFTE